LQGEGVRSVEAGLQRLGHDRASSRGLIADSSDCALKNVALR
jgi:hypothetical protein